MNLIDIVTHCYAGKWPHYAEFLRYHLRTLESACLRIRFGCRPRVWVFHTDDDPKTAEVLSQYVSNPKCSLSVLGKRLPLEQLGRRAIGRNEAALASSRDIVWFCDVDHAITFSCIDELMRLEWPDDACMIYPKEIKISKDHKTGDEYARQPRTVLQPQDFVSKRYNRAIGGVQIVKGEYARRYGYLPNTKWQMPVDKPFGNFRDDLAYRMDLKSRTGKQIKGMCIPGIYRLRHSATTYQ